MRAVIKINACPSVADRRGAGRVEADEVSLDQIAGHTRFEKQHAVIRVTGNDVAAGDIRLRAQIKIHARPAIRHGGISSGVQTDVISQRAVVRRAVEQNPVLSVAGKDVARTNEIVLRAVADFHSGIPVGNCARADRIQTDEISGDGVVRRGGTGDINALKKVAGNDIARRSGKAAD